MNYGHQILELIATGGSLIWLDDYEHRFCLPNSNIRYIGYRFRLENGFKTVLCNRYESSKPVLDFETGEISYERRRVIQGRINFLPCYESAYKRQSIFESLINSDSNFSKILTEKLLEQTSRSRDRQELDDTSYVTLKTLLSRRENHDCVVSILYKPKTTLSQFQQLEDFNSIKEEALMYKLKHMNDEKISMIRIIEY